MALCGQGVLQNRAQQEVRWPAISASSPRLQRHSVTGAGMGGIESVLTHEVSMGSGEKASLCASPQDLGTVT